MKVFDIMKLASRFEHMLLAILDELIDRYDRNPDYHFIDTKLDLLTGRDFGPEDAWYQRRETIYPWIQGRALEALAGHWRWLADCTILPAAGRTARTNGKISGRASDGTRKGSPDSRKETEIPAPAPGDCPGVCPEEISGSVQLKGA